MIQKITKGYELKAKHIIHTVGPVYSGSDDDARFLSSCYKRSLDIARDNELHSIAFIDEMGLIPKSRLYVHLSWDEETASAWLGS